MKHIKIIIFSALTVALSGCLGSFLEPKEDPTVFYVMRSQQDVEKVELSASSRTILRLRLQNCRFMFIRQCLSIKAQLGCAYLFLIL